MNWLPTVASTTYEQEYGKKAKDTDRDEYLSSSKAQERAK
jgi:hypothetical protein